MIPEGKIRSYALAKYDTAKTRIRILDREHSALPFYTHTQCKWHQMREEAPKQPNDHL